MSRLIGSFKLLQMWANEKYGKDEWTPSLVTCISCAKAYDEREVFVTMGIVYCPNCVVYVLRNRIFSEQRDKIVKELQRYPLIR